MSVTNIQKSLEDLTSFYTQLISLAKEKRDVLVKNEVSKLNIMISKESDIIKDIVIADQNRMQQVNVYLGQKGIVPNESTTMNDVLKFIDDIYQKKSLATAQHKLLSLINEVKELNLLNTELIKQSLAHIDYSLNVITGTVEQEVTYKRPNHANTYHTEQPGSRFNSSI